MVVVEQDDEQPDVRPRGLALLVDAVADLARRRTVDRLRDRIDLDDRNVSTFCGLPSSDPEVVLLQIDHRLAVLVGDDDVDADVVDAAAEARRRLRFLLWGC